MRTDALYPDLAPARPISGAEAFDRHIEHTVPLLRETGGPCLIGPGDERWNLAMRVRQAGAVSFPSFVSHAAYLAGLGHRIAVVVDSGLPPLSEMSRPVAVERATP
ncbi:hypothetical protein AA12717_3037 [Gluconacetobacter sacchari DSM 12717]|uniref:Uncharacterized protein n=2 Tax=Gluconacetobacter sacchari TaxID=92759 RepID=A0A7W4NL47_9PROT|nr:hypothetical protein [Gluconacetobacter sacchari]MBB2159779.1 hypothetical protein [Gluconacetobacter sacchari]GBQ28733.1 hypothetical protein AA12717_3037 [Gluconacetobacter sacchari DSM 12717]